MGLSKFDANARIRYAGLASAVSNLSTGAYTMLFGVRFEAISGSKWDAFGYLLRSTGNGIAQAGLSRNAGNNNITNDIETPGNQEITTQDPVLGTDYIFMLSKTAGTTAPIFSRYQKSTNAWIHTTGGTTFGNKAAATFFEIASWQNGSDLFDGWYALVAGWSGAMSQTDKEALVTNWRTSDLWTSAHGQPVYLIEGNVTPSSWVDLAGNLSSPTITGTPTLDAGQTFTSFNFDGTGASGTETTDSGTVVVVLTPSGTEFKEILDSGTVPILLTPSGTDVVADVDANTVVFSLTPSAVEGKELTDANTAYVDITPSSTDIQENVDTGTARISITPSGTEFREISDASTVPLSLTPSSVDTAQFVDSNTVPFTITPSSTDDQDSGGVDAATVRVTLTPTSTDVFAGVDSGTAIVVLTPSGSDIRDSVDTATVSYVITPSGVDVKESGSVDAATVSYKLTPSSLDTLAGVDSLTVYYDIDASASEVYTTPSATDAATVYVKITPGVFVEVFYPFDSLLVGRLSTQYTATLSGNRFSASLQGRRFSAGLAGTRWSAVISKRWSGIIGRK